MPFHVATSMAVDSYLIIYSNGNSVRLICSSERKIYTVHEQHYGLQWIFHEWIIHEVFCNKGHCFAKSSSCLLSKTHIYVQYFCKFGTPWWHGVLVYSVFTALYVCRCEINEVIFHFSTGTLVSQSQLFICPWDLQLCPDLPSEHPFD